MRDYDVSWKDVSAMLPGTEKAIQIVVYGLMVDEGHHKQWFLEQALIALGVEPDEPRQALELAGYGVWEPGIAP
jgi:hypothetical protein